MVSSPSELDDVRLDPTGTYTQTADIDMSSFGTFDAISDFSGEYDGNGFTISNLTVSETDTAGLFAEVSGGTVKNLGLIDPDVTGEADTGSLVGWHQNGGLIDNCYAQNVTVSETSFGYAGGLVGFVGNSSADVTNCHVDGGTVSGDDPVGGFVGEMYEGSISGSYTTATADGNDSVGGFTGTHSSGDITNCYAESDVTGSPADAGGFVGFISSGTTIQNCHATGSVTGGNNAGGFIGNVNVSAGTIEYCYATGSVSGGSQVGGFVGDGGDGISRCYANVTVSGGTNVGGFVGRGGNSTFDRCYSVGEVTSGNNSVGGFAGRASGDLNYVYSTAQIPDGATNAGSFVGYDDGPGIIDSYVSMAVGGVAFGVDDSFTDTSNLTQIPENTMSGAKSLFQMFGFEDDWIMRAESTPTFPGFYETSDVEVSGTVTYDGSPIDGAVVEIASQTDSTLIRTATDANGQYDLYTDMFPTGTNMFHVVARWEDGNGNFYASVSNPDVEVTR